MLFKGREEGVFSFAFLEGMKASVLRAATKLAERGSIESCRCQGEVTGQVIDLAVCKVQLMKRKHKSLGVQGPQKQLLQLLL